MSNYAKKMFPKIIFFYAILIFFSQFKHIVHVGWSAQKGYDLNSDEVNTLQTFLEKAGVSTGIICVNPRLLNIDQCYNLLIFSHFVMLGISDTW